MKNATPSADKLDTPNKSQSGLSSPSNLVGQQLAMSRVWTSMVTMDPAMLASACWLLSVWIK